jgi:class 3 adenylate cyclase
LAKRSDEPQIRVADAFASESIEGERKTVTALFADIKGSTELMRELDPEEARAIVDPAIRLMIDAAHCYNGYVVDQRRDFCTVRSGGCVVRSPRLMLGYPGATFGSFVAITRTHGGISDGNHFNRWMRLRRDPL